jgi:hypothetical protein
MQGEQIVPRSEYIAARIDEVRMVVGAEHLQSLLPAQLLRRHEE